MHTVTDSHALSTLLQQAERERDETATRLAQAESLLQRQQSQLSQLQAYRAEYAARTPGQGGRAAAIELLRCHQAFMQRLDQALVHQQGQVEAARRRSSAEREALVAQELRVASVRKLLDRRQLAAQHVAQRREQHRSDEAAQRRHWATRQAQGGWLS